MHHHLGLVPMKPCCPIDATGTCIGQHHEDVHTGATCNIVALACFQTLLCDAGHVAEITGWPCHGSGDQLPNAYESACCQLGCAGRIAEYTSLKEGFEGLISDWASVLLDEKKDCKMIAVHMSCTL